jgi:hypothetical protein
MLEVYMLEAPWDPRGKAPDLTASGSADWQFDELGWIDLSIYSDDFRDGPAEFGLLLVLEGTSRLDCSIELTLVAEVPSRGSTPRSPSRWWRYRAPPGIPDREILGARAGALRASTELRYSPCTEGTDCRRNSVTELSLARCLPPPYTGCESLRSVAAVSPSTFHISRPHAGIKMSQSAVLSFPCHASK